MNTDPPAPIHVIEVRTIPGHTQHPQVTLTWSRVPTERWRKEFKKALLQLIQEEPEFLAAVKTPLDINVKSITRGLTVGVSLTAGDMGETSDRAVSRRRQRADGASRRGRERRDSRRRCGNERSRPLSLIGGLGDASDRRKFRSEGFSS
jgi:hypothetical protein